METELLFAKQEFWHFLEKVETELRVMGFEFEL